MLRTDHLCNLLIKDVIPPSQFLWPSHSCACHSFTAGGCAGCREGRWVYSLKSLAQRLSRISLVVLASSSSQSLQLARGTAATESWLERPLLEKASYGLDICKWWCSFEMVLPPELASPRIGMLSSQSHGGTGTACCAFWRLCSLLHVAVTLLNECLVLFTSWTGTL